MAPSRGKGKARAANNPAASISSAKRTPRSTRRTKDDVPGVFQDLLAEAAGTDSANDVSDRPLKRRRVATSVSVPEDRDAESIHNKGSRGAATKNAVEKSTRNLQTIEYFSQSDDDDESDFAFEDVDLEQPSATTGREEDDIADVSISVDPETTPKRHVQAKRKPGTAAEAVRLLVHKAHVLCLLGHCISINSWCNNAVVQRHLRSTLSKRTISYLNPKADESQFQRNRSFMDGLQQASEAFRMRFTITASGLRRAKWNEDGEASTLQPETDVLDRSDFITAAKNFEGSQDTGNQLFCALLRAAGLEARLVCSLQPLPFTNVSAKSSTPQKQVKPTIFAMVHGPDSATSDSNTDDASVKSSTSIGKVPSARRRLGQPSFAAELSTTSTPNKKKSIRKLTYPVFWVEAFNTAQQKWIAIDPIVTNTISKPSKLEPPSSYDLNHMSYVIAFESDGVARDVTRRYTKAFNAKTRRHRVESTENGALWFKKAMRIFRRRGQALDRDQVEDAELAQKEAREGLPLNVQDFKDHPYYALERHLKRHEVIHPKREVGKVNAGTAAKPRMEAVYRRQDVLLCRSADKWYRLGREIQEGEQAVKRVPARQRRARSLSPGEDDDGGAASMTPLYAPYQTQLYVPPPVVKGCIPRNAFGNLDIYVPSMVPTGGAHVRHRLAQQAARTLRVDFADAVTGFQFKGRHGTAIIEGAVVPAQHEEAVWAVIDGLQDEQAEEESKARSSVALRMWRRFLTGLRIAERVSGYGDPKDAEEIRREVDEAEDERDEVVEAGGFFPNEGADEVALPTAGRFSLEELHSSARISKRGSKKLRDEDSEEEEAELTPNDDVHDYIDANADYQRSRKSTRSRRKVVDEESEDEHILEDADHDDADEETSLFGNEEAGGFVPGDITEDDGGGGGFLPEDAEMTTVDDGGGGFLVQDGSHAELPLAPGSEVPPQTDTEMAGGFLADDADDEPGVKETIAPQNTQMDTDLMSSTQHDEIGYADQELAIAVDGHDANSAHDADVSKPVVEIAVNNTEMIAGNDKAEISSNADQTTPKANTADADQSDRGSMLSHDPEDDDMEPDWLESD